MITAGTRLGASHVTLMTILRDAPELREGPELTRILELLRERRAMDLSDLPPAEQATLISARSQELLPSVDDLAARLAAADAEGRKLIVKFGIDPTAADVHVGHAVPMIIASRFQRMGHQVVFIVGDITAKIGDPSGRTADRPPLTDDDIRSNMATYRDQVTPFFDFTRADFRYNSEWLAPITLPEFIGVLEKLPVAASLQREDFRTRLAAGSGLTMAELVYSVVMALDSVKITADIELGGLDQLLNMQMCRRVMENSGQQPEIVIATGLIEGTDGTGAKMSKSKGNYVGLAFEPKDVFGKLMSAADRLLPAYLRALTELLDPEIDLLMQLMADRKIHPMGVKTLLASDVTAAVHGIDQAEAARDRVHRAVLRQAVLRHPGPARGHAGRARRLDSRGAVRQGHPACSQPGAGPAGRRGRRAPPGHRGARQRTRKQPSSPRPTRPPPSESLLKAHEAVTGQPGARNFLKCGRFLIETK